MEEKVIILGDSPFLQEVSDKVNYVTERYYTIGINNIINKFHTHAHIFTDMPFINLTNSRQDLKTISLYMYGDMIQKDNKELYDTYSFKAGEDKVENNGKLAWCGFTHDYATSYCIHKGVKEVILLGAADFSQSGHFATLSDFKFSEKLREQSLKFIEDTCTKYVKIKTCNPNSKLNVERISIDELLKPLTLI